MTTAFLNHRLMTRTAILTAIFQLSSNLVTRQFPERSLARTSKVYTYQHQQTHVWNGFSRLVHSEWDFLATNKSLRPGVKESVLRLDRIVTSHFEERN